ncbi:MAG: hypothetical protein H7Y17_05370 [Chlorobia bacterium]|nr:hypothetical protein [Fimbriimonadaceae bacterium]
MSNGQSSIQRFLQNRASQIVMGNYGRSAFGWHIGIGAALVALSVGMVIGGIASGIAGLIFGALGPLIGGGINLGIGLALRRRLQQTPNEAKLSSEAKSFIVDLMKQTHTGWNSSHGYGPFWTGVQKTAPPASPLVNGETIFHQLGKHWGMIPKTPKDILPKPLNDVLETACYHYNRIFGILEGTRGDSTFSKIAQSAKSGADEAIFGILHHAATMHRFPETISSASRDCEDKIRALKELADGLETMQSRPATISDRLGYSSAMESALEEVRLERLAREELGRPDEDQHLRERL